MAMMRINKMLSGIRRFARAEKGLVTVEWVALSAGMVVAAIAIAYVVMTNTKTQAKSIGSGIQTTRNNVFGPNGSKL